MAKLVRSVCTACGYAGAPYKQIPGSFAVEVILWFFFMIPGLIYSVWRLTSGRPMCPACDREAMIPTATPRGWELAMSRGGWTDEAEKSYIKIAKRAWIGTVGWALFSWFWVIVWFSFQKNFMGVLSLVAAVPMTVTALLNFPKALALAPTGDRATDR